MDGFIFRFLIEIFEIIGGVLFISILLLYFILEGFIVLLKVIIDEYIFFFDDINICIFNFFVLLYLKFELLGCYNFFKFR